MKRILMLMLPLVLLLFSGCSEGMTAGGIGVAVGGALQETFAGAEADLERHKQEKIEELRVANVRLANAVEEVEKAAAQAEVTALKKKVERLSDTQGGVELAKEGFKVDWTDPAAVGGYASTLLTSGIMLWFRNKNKREATKRSAEKTAKTKTINELKAMEPAKITADVVETLLFNNTGQQRAYQKVA